MESASRARLQVLAAALLFSTGGMAIKACGLTGWQVAAFRSGTAAIALALVLPGARRGWTWRTWLVGVAYAATLLTYVQANKLTTAANAIFLQSTAPLYLLLFGPLLLKEPIRARDLGFMAAIAAGLGMFFVGLEPVTRTASNPALGNLVAAASGLTWGLTIAGLRWLARSERDAGGAAAGATIVGNTLVLLVCLPWALPIGPSTPVDWLWIAYLGVFQIGLAYYFMTRGLRGVRALESGLLLLIEPVLNPLWTWLFHGETPGPWARAGAATILLATAAHSVLATRRARA